VKCEEKPRKIRPDLVGGEIPDYHIGNMRNKQQRGMGALLGPVLLCVFLGGVLPPVRHAAAENRLVLFLGDSLTAGYGIDPSEAFPALIQEKIESRGWKFSVVNAGKSGETTAGGLRRLNWLLRRKIDILVLQLGGNDGLRGIATDVTRRNLQAMIDKTKTRYPAVKFIIAGMQVPPNLGERYGEEFRQIFIELSKKNRSPLIPFLLEGVGGIPTLNLPDGIHPTAEGHKIVAQNVWKVLEPVLISSLHAS
jgi:acyl-CoA thioesterase-1